MYRTVDQEKTFREGIVEIIDCRETKKNIPDIPEYLKNKYLDYKFNVFLEELGILKKIRDKYYFSFFTNDNYLNTISNFSIYNDTSELNPKYLKAEEDLRDAIWKERAATFGAAMNTIANSFGSAVSGAFNDIFMNKGFDMKKFRTTLAQGFASAGSKLIGDMAQKAVFGNKGLIANMMRGMGVSGDWINTLFPKSELEMAQERTNYLKNMWEKGVKITLTSRKNN